MASRHPSRPHAHRTPVRTARCPISAVSPRCPVTRCPPETIEAAIPVPMGTNTRSSVPTPAPSLCSATPPEATSLATRTGSRHSAPSDRTSSRLRHPRLALYVAMPASRSTRPGTTTPAPTTGASGRCASRVRPPPASAPGPDLGQVAAWGTWDAVSALGLVLTGVPSGWTNAVVSKPSSAATVSRTALTVRAATLGPASPLPRFTRLRELPYPDVGPGATPDMLERIAYGRLETPLPYRLQEDYDRSLREVELPAYVLENGVLRATVLPTLGGRVWSLHDDARGRGLLFRNPVLYFANFGLTDAWFAGGIEWNLGSTGHTTLSCRPMHAAVVAGPDGDVLRLWEWERTRDLVLQVDLSLLPGSDRLYASTRVINPDPEEKPLYYWTNIAVPESPGTRVLTTADAAWRTEYTGALIRVPVPYPDRADVDISHPMASRSPADYFYDLQGQRGRHIVSVEPDGGGFAQTPTRGRRGRKRFRGGGGPAGSRWRGGFGGPGAG